MTTPHTTSEPQETITPEAAQERIGVLRDRINAVDDAIIELVTERIALSGEVGRLRMSTGGTRLVLSREQEIISRFTAKLGPEGTPLAMLLLRASRGTL